MRARRLPAIPLPVVLIAVVGAAMLIPGAMAFLGGDARTGRAFVQSGGLVVVLALLLAVALAPGTARAVRRRLALRNDPLVVQLVAFLALPPLMALPVAEALGSVRMADAWFEMLSSFTTTGATLFDTPRDIPPAVHLWRAMAGWLGGLLVLATALTLLGAQELGTGWRPYGSAEANPFHSVHLHGTAARAEGRPPASRLARDLSALLPAYAGVTIALWVGLQLAGNPALLAAMQAMSAISTSGILPGRSMGPAGLWAEVMIFAVLLLALSRRTMPGAPPEQRARRWRDDPELRLAAALVGLVTALIVLRHWAGAAQVAEADNLPAAGRALWGGAFTALSFLTTTGFVSHDWVAARAWSGLTSPGLILMGLALVGGGVATTAGGVRLMRVHALVLQGLRETEKLAHPSSVGGEGAARRALRGEGAFRAWLVLMVFLTSLIAVLAALLLTGVRFEAALVYATAALSTTGPLVQVATETPLSWAALSDPARAVLGLAMILGRMELLLLLMLLAGRLDR